MKTVIEQKALPQGPSIFTTSGTDKRKNLRKYQIDGTQKLFGDVTATVAVNWMDSEIAKAIIEALKILFE